MRNTQAYEHERAHMKLKADGLGRYHGCAYDVKTETIVEASARPVLEQALADHFLRLYPEAVMIDQKLFEHTVPKGMRSAARAFRRSPPLNLCTCVLSAFLFCFALASMRTVAIDADSLLQLRAQLDAAATGGGGTGGTVDVAGTLTLTPPKP